MLNRNAPEQFRCDCLTGIIFVHISQAFGEGYFPQWKSGVYLGGLLNSPFSVPQTAFYN